MTLETESSGVYARPIIYDYEFPNFSIVAFFSLSDIFPRCVTSERSININPAAGKTSPHFPAV